VRRNVLAPVEFPPRQAPCYPLDASMIATAASAANKVWTEAELQALPDDGFTTIGQWRAGYEPEERFFPRATFCIQLSTRLSNYVTERRLGAVLDSAPASG